MLSKNAKSSEVPHRNKDEVLQTERNDKYLPSTNHICLKEEKLNRSFTVVAHILFCHQPKDYLYCIVYIKVPLEPRNLACSLTRILLATLMERGRDRNSHLIYPRGGALGYFLGGYVPPRTPNWHPVLKTNSPKIDTPF